MLAWHCVRTSRAHCGVYSCWPCVVLLRCLLTLSATIFYCSTPSSVFSTLVDKVVYKHSLRCAVALQCCTVCGAGLAALFPLPLIGFLKAVTLFCRPLCSPTLLALSARERVLRVVELNLGSPLGTGDAIGGSVWPPVGFLHVLKGMGHLLILRGTQSCSELLRKLTYQGAHALENRLN